MLHKFKSRKFWIVLLLFAAVFFGVVYRYHDVILGQLTAFFAFCNDRDRVSAAIESFGAAGPVVLILVQILQVVFAPLPGESTFGLVGGYLFGAVWGFVYSSIGLTLGSIVNFSIGRFFGKRYVRKIIPADQLSKFDILIKHQGLFVIFLLFLIPGFPKDYLCLFLGLTAIPLRVFALITVIGRIPGTFTFSLLGAGLYDRHYYLVVLIFILFLGAVLLAYQYKTAIYRWIERMNGN